jgi:superfamily II DNA/RNA helicase
MTTQVKSILKLHPALRQSLSDLRIECLTRIQDAAFVPVSAHRDVVIHAQCGAGKTMAYLLPLLNRRLFIADHITQTSVPPVLILQPSNVLCEQVTSVVSDLLGHSSKVRVQHVAETRAGARVITSPRIHWGEADVVVATPSKYLADLSRGFPAPSTVVLDEADLLLQGHSALAVQNILEDFRGQTVLSAATIPNALGQRINRRWSTAIWALDDFWHGLYPSSGLSTHWVEADDDKRVQLAGEVLPFVLHKLGTNDRKLRVLVFCETTKRANEVATFLRERGWPASTAISDQPPEDLEVVCVTDGAGRGVDWRGVRAIVNFNCPGDIQTFLHRVGRLASVRGLGDSASSVVVTVTESEPEKRRMAELRRVVDGDKVHALFSTRRSLHKKLQKCKT